MINTWIRNYIIIVSWWGWCFDDHAWRLADYGAVDDDGDAAAAAAAAAAADDDDDNDDDDDDGWGLYPSVVALTQWRQQLSSMVCIPRSKLFFCWIKIMKLYNISNNYKRAHELWLGSFLTDHMRLKTYVILY